MFKKLKIMIALKQIFEERGWYIDSLNRLRPSQSKLEELGFNTMNQWNKALNGEVELTFKQAKALSVWLGIDFERLLDLKVEVHK